MVQRLLGFRIPGLHLEPNTLEKKIWNTKRVLEELSVVCGENLHESYISPEAIVQGDERHIALLVRVMYHIALHMMRDRQREENTDEQAAQFANAASQMQEGHIQHHEDPSSATNTSSSSGPKQVIHKRPVDGRHPKTSTAEEFVSEPPSNESLAFTKELVAGWDQSVVPPPKRSRGALVDPLSVIELQHRIRRLDQSLQDVHGRGRGQLRPCSHDSRSHGSFSASSYLDKQFFTQLQNSARDAKIERIRNTRFVDKVQHSIQREAVTQRSKAEQHALLAFRDVMRTKRHNRAAAARQVRDDDAALRRAAEALVESERNRLRLRSHMMSDETSRLVTQNFAAARETRKVLKENQVRTSRKFHDDISRLREAVGSWRTQLKLAPENH